MSRLRIWLLALGSAWSQLWQVIWSGPLFVAGLAPAPDPDETISALVGRQSAQGWRWALVAAWIIDRVMLPLERWQLGHCGRAAALHAGRFRRAE